MKFVNLLDMYWEDLAAEKDQTYLDLLKSLVNYTDFGKKIQKNDMFFVTNKDYTEIAAYEERGMNQLSTYKSSVIIRPSHTVHPKPEQTLFRKKNPFEYHGKCNGNFSTLYLTLEFMLWRQV